MRKTAGMAIAAAILLGTAACSRASKSGPEAALDRAYQAGILSKSEYDAKRAALLASAGAPPAAAPASPAPAPPPPPPAAAPAPPPEPAPVTPPPPRPAVAPAARPAKPAVQQPAPAPAPERVKEAPEPVSQAPAPPPPPPARVPPAPVVPDEKPSEPAPTAACADTEIRPGKEKGKQERFYPVAAPKVRAALLQALKDLEFEVHKASGAEIEASKKRHIGLVVGSGGEKLTISIEESTESGRKGTLVIGETKKGFVMRAGQKSWTNALFEQTGCVLHTRGTAISETAMR